jgi:hypothetical protein
MFENGMLRRILRSKTIVEKGGENYTLNFIL